MKASAPILVVSLLLSSCAYHIGTVGGGSAVITNANFSHVDFAYGTARTTHFFGIGGAQKDALVLEAKRNLYQNYNLRPKQAIGQTIVDFKRKIFFPFLFTKVTVSAEIIDFSADRADTVLAKTNLNQFTGISASGGFALGDTVSYQHYGNTLKARVLSKHQGFNNSLKYTIQYYDRKNRLKIKRVSSSRLQYSQQSLLRSGQPLELKHQGRLYTPVKPENKLVRFKYQGQEFTGELLDRQEDTYVIGMQKEDSEKVSIRINEKDIIE
jgi:hypothetical protein